MITVIYLKLSKFKYICNYMLMCAKKLKSSDHLDILHASSTQPVNIFQSNKLYILEQIIEF